MLVVTQQGLLKHMQKRKKEVKGEDVSDPDILKAVETAVKESTSVKRIKIEGGYLRWTNVATAILKGVTQSKALRELELRTPEDFPPPQEVVDDVRRANPKLRLVVRTEGKSASHDITCHLLAAAALEEGLPLGLPLTEGIPLTDTPSGANVW